MKEIAIGEIAEINGIKVRCVVTQISEHGRCSSCIGFKFPKKCAKLPACSDSVRSDGNLVHFEAVTK